MEKPLATLEDLSIGMLKVEMQLAMTDFAKANDTETCELRFLLERTNREVMKLENIALNKLYKLATWIPPTVSRAGCAGED